MSRNGLQKSIYSVNGISSYPLTKRTSFNCRVNVSAHWYVAIICNLDQAKPREKVIKHTPRTRSQVDRASPELVELENQILSSASTPTMVIEPDNEIIDVSVEQQPPDVIDVDNAEMDRSFGRMSISREEETYNFEEDPDIDAASRKEIQALVKGDAKRYTRQSMTIQNEDTIDVDEEPDSITSALKQKYGRKLTTRRTSNRIVPPDSYVLYNTELMIAL